MEAITRNFLKIKSQVPATIKIVLAVKKRTPEEIAEVINAGATDLGHNYVQEAENMINALGDQAKTVRWHLIGHLQKNKINKALPLFGMIQTVDSIEKARALDLRAGKINKTIECLIEINSGFETAKAGLEPNEQALEVLCREFSALQNLSLKGLMTMGPSWDDPEKNRPYFRRVRELRDYIRSLDLPNIEMTELSMGMSHSYEIALEEGATIIRPGSVIFGSR